MTKLFYRSRRVTLDIYEAFKYTASKEIFENCKTVTYDHCTGFEVVDGERAAEIEADTDGSCIDDIHEYLVLFFEDGNTATFRNSYVDLFAM